MGTNTILRNVLLLEGKDYTPEQIDVKYWGAI